MELQALSVLVEVAQSGSFAEAARRRDVDPSSISRTIAALEDRLGFRLFQRTTRSLSLTEAGDIYVQRIAPLVEEAARAVAVARDVAREPTGTLRITASVSYGQAVLVPLLPAFRRQYPDLGLDLVLSDSILDPVVDRLDLAIRLGMRPEIDAITAKLADTRYRVCAGPGFLKRHGPIERPQDLSRVDCLLFPFAGFRSRWLFRPAGEDVFEIPVSGKVVASNAMALFQLAVADEGPALLANWTADDAIARGDLVDLFPDHDVTATDFDTGVWLLYPSRAYLPSKVRVFIDFLKAAVN